MSDLFERLKASNASSIMNIHSSKETKNINEESEYYSDDYDDDYEPEIPDMFVEDNRTLEQKVNNSRLPSAIKEIMLKKPIVYDQINDHVPNKILENKKTMELMGIKKPQQKNMKMNPKHIDNTKLLSEIESIIEKVVDRKFKEHAKTLNKETLMESINENLLIKVGGTVFQGKITGVKK